MSTPRDDEFNLPYLDSKWTWHTDGSSLSTYSLTLNPLSFTLLADAITTLFTAPLTDVPYIKQSNNYQYFFSEINILDCAFTNDNQHAGVMIYVDANHWILLAKVRLAGVSSVVAYEYISGTLNTVATAVFPDEVDVVLRIRNKNGKISFLYKVGGSTFFTQLGTDLTPAVSYDNADTGLFATAEGNAFSPRFDYFHLRSLLDVLVHADMLIICTNIKIVNADMQITIITYEPVGSFEVRQEILTNKVHIYWTNPPSDPRLISVRILRKLGSYPQNMGDGVIVIDAIPPVDNAIDTLLPDMIRSKAYYSAFVIYG